MVRPTLGDMQLDSSLRLIAIERSGIMLVKRHAMLTEICHSLCTELAVDDVQVNVVTASHQIFVAEWPQPKKKRKPNPISNSGCREVVLSDEPVIIPDSRQHPIMCLMPWVKDWLGYVGVPIRFDGQPLGSLCVLTRDTREWTEAEIAVVTKYADKVSRSL